MELKLFKWEIAYHCAVAFRTLNLREHFAQLITKTSV